MLTLRSIAAQLQVPAIYKPLVTAAMGMIPAATLDAAITVHVDSGRQWVTVKAGNITILDKSIAEVNNYGQEDPGDPDKRQGDSGSMPGPGRHGCL